VTTATAERAGEDGEAPPQRRWRASDIVVVLVFTAYTFGALSILALGVGAVAASASESLHTAMHDRGFGGLGLIARSYLRMADASHHVPSGTTIAIDYTFSVLNIALAIFLLWLRPRDRTARLLAFALVGTAGVFNLTAQSAVEGLVLLPWETAVQVGAHITAGLAYMFALILFADGRPIPRWPWPAQAALYAPAVAISVFLALRVEGSSRPASLLLFFGLAVPVAGVAAQAYRFRRATTLAEYQQSRLLFWALLPALGVGIWFVATQGLGAAEVGLAGRHLPEQPVAVFRIFQPVFLLVPFALFVGLLRYRLWDIDRVVNRTLVYGVLTGTLGGAYLGIVVLLQRAFAPVTRESDLAVAISTLLVAAAFVPARRWVQDFVDRRFYRHRYDAQRTIEAFSTRLRDHLDMEALTSELRGAVADTMQPASVTLLLKRPEGGLAWQWTYRPRGRP
jgi:hypothetical protein